MFKRLLLCAALALLPHAAYGQAQQSGITPVAAGKTISATTASSSVTMGANGSTAVLWNVGSVGVYYTVGATATTANPFLPAGSAITLNIPPSAVISAITASGSSTVQITQGFGWPSISFGGAVTVAGSVSVTQGTSPWVVSGTVTTTNASVGATGAAVPASADYVGINIGGNLTGAVGGHGTAAGALRVELPTDGTGVVGLNAGSAIIGKVGIDQTTPGTTNLVAAGQNGTWTVQPGNTPNTTPWLTTNTPSSASGAATTSASSTAAASNLVLKASAGNLYGLTITIGATSGYAMLFDATSLPSNGAVTPVWCYPVTSNGTNGGAAIEFATPKRFGTGITAGFSTTGCFTLTASATANFFGGYQ